MNNDIRKVLIISDSHGVTENLTQAMELEKPDMIVHLGDICGDEPEVEGYCGAVKPFVLIRGNCDYVSAMTTPTAVFTLGKHKIFAAHGHMQKVDFGLNNLYYSAKENGCDIAMYGHTHVPFDETFDDVRILNPGSVSRPRGGSDKGYMIMTLDADGDIKEIVRKSL